MMLQVSASRVRRKKRGGEVKNFIFHHVNINEDGTSQLFDVSLCILPWTPIKCYHDNQTGTT